jgi:hypothetical protein
MATSGEACEGADGVLHVGHLLCLRRLAQIAALGAKADEGRRRSVGDFIGDDIDALVAGDGDYSILGAKVQAHDRHGG